MEGFTVESRPQRVVFGAGSAQSVPEQADLLGASRVLVVSGGSSNPLGDQIAGLLGGRAVARLTEVRQHVPEPLALAAREVAARHRIDAIVAVGGGSAVGLGKAVAVTTGAPIVAVPTTYAGSERTDVWGMTTGGHKKTARDVAALPRVVLYDPVAASSLPPRATAATGFNAIAHAVEGCYGPLAGALTRLHAIEGIRVLAAALPRCTAKPADPDARGEAFYGAYLAGLAFAVTGSALHHKLCHILGGTHRLVHGDLNAVLLPHVLAFNAPAVPGLAPMIAAALAEATGVAEPDPALALRRLSRHLCLPTTLAELGVPAQALDEAAELAAEEVRTVNPRPASPGQIRELLADAHAGREPHTA
jgi:maleylacetate reductase